MQNKKSQSVPLLIILLALFLVLYIYLLPYEEKCKFIKLPECPAAETAEGKESIASSSGFVEGKVEYNLQNILLKSQHESDIAKIFENAKIEEGLFFSSPDEEAFSLHEKSDEAKLFVYVQEEKCVINCGLDVIINGFVFETVEGEGMHEITIPSFKLKETNFIKLRAKKPYLPFITNSYKISNVVARENYLLEGSKESVSFDVSIKEDLANLKTASLVFDAECITKDKLTLMINDEVIEEKKICGNYKKSINIEKENSISFSTKGNYYIKNAKLELEFEGIKNPSYYFDFTDEEYEKIKNGTRIAMLELVFGSTEKKEMTLHVNGLPLSVETNRLIYKTRINDYVERNNIVILEPKTYFELRSMEVYVN